MFLTIKNNTLQLGDVFSFTFFVLK